MTRPLLEECVSPRENRTLYLGGGEISVEAVQVPHRDDERTARSTRMGGTPITIGEGLGTGNPTSREDDRDKQAATTIQDTARRLREGKWIR